MNQALQTLRHSTSTRATLVIWVLTMLSLPLLGWILGEDYLLRGMSVGVLMQAAAVLVILYNSWGWQRTLLTFGLVGSLSYFAEYVGSQTGVLFGKYHYTDLLQPQIAGVPLLIPLAWMMMLPPAWAIAQLITRRTGRNWRFVAVAALAFTAWDLFLDPQMVGWRFWIWEQPGYYFGIPLSNYLGWLVVSSILTIAANPKNIPAGPLSLVYVLTWALQTIGQGVFWSQPGPAIFGFIGAGIFVALAFFRSKDGTGTI